jgi:hypothetical protein
VAALQSAMVSLPAGGPAVDAGLLGVLALACRDGERLRFSYTDRDGTGSRRHVEPYRLVCAGRRWYLVARDLDRDDWRSFRVDRLAEPLPTGVRSRPVDPPDAARYVSEGTAAGPYRWRARVVLQAPADVVAAQVPATAAVVEAMDDERCLLLTGADRLEVVVAHLLQLATPFTMLEPPELRERCRMAAGSATGMAACVASGRNRSAPVSGRSAANPSPSAECATAAASSTPSSRGRSARGRATAASTPPGRTQRAIRGRTSDSGRWWSRAELTTAS